MGSIDLLEDASADLPHTTKRMFGGHGLFAPNGGMFAGVVDDDRIILKLADETARAQLEAIGGRAWTYRDRMTMKEWILVPDAFYDEPRTLAEWARVAHRLVPPKAAKKPSGKKAPAKRRAAPRKGAKKR